MPSLRIITPKGNEYGVPLNQDILVIGRTREADILLEDEGISRRHIQLRKVGTDYLVTDLSSRNGAFLNGVRLDQERALHHGDRINIGQTRLVFAADNTLATNGAIHIGQDDPRLRTSVFRTNQPADAKSRLESPLSVVENRQPLSFLNELSKTILGISEERALAERVAREALDWFKADCCAVVYHRAVPGGYQLDIQSIACADPGATRDLTISYTAARQVIDERLALLITNAGHDARFKEQENLVARGVTAILCAPLWNEDHVFGLVYLDTTGPGNRLTQDHLGLLSSVANLAAIKIDNLRLFADAMAKTVMDRELALAAEIQSLPLPGGSSSVSGLHCLGFNHACSRVGGDYFDFIPFNDEVLTVTIADVTGHGPAGALLMAACKSMLTALIDTGLPLLERVARLNRYLLKHTAANQFITFFHGEINRRTETLTYCNGGHNPPIFIPGDGDLQTLTGGGIPLGIMDFPYAVATVPFTRGSKLALYTDGITESQNREDEEYGEQRLLALANAQRALTARTLCDAILASVEAFSEGVAHRDDVTLAFVEYPVE